MLFLNALRCLLVVTCLTVPAAAQDAPSTSTELTIPGLPSQAPPPSVVDTVNLFRGHPELRTQLENVLADLANETDVDLWLVTTSFQTRNSPAQEAAEIVTAWSGDRPAVVLLYIRGNHRSGIAANSSLQEIVPSFELAGSLPASSDSDSARGPDSLPDTEARVTSLVETSRKLADLVRRYASSEPQAPVASDSETSSPPSPRHAESLLLIAVIVIAALIVIVTARTTRG